MDRAEQNRERRDAEVARSHNTNMPSPFATKVVGVSFVPAYPENLHMLDHEQREAQYRGEPLVAVLIRNPDNAYDSNAIEVHVPALGTEWAMIGHLTRPVAARLAPELDAGERWQALVESVLIVPEHMDRPGISVVCKRVGDDAE